MQHLTQTEPSGAPRGIGVGLSGAVGVMAVLALVVAGVARALGDERVPAASIWAFGLIGGGVLLHRLGRRVAGERGPLVVSLGLGSVAPWIALGSLWALSDPLISTHWRCGTGDMGLVVVAPVVVFFATTTTASIASLIAARPRRAVDPSLYILATATGLVAAALVVGSLYRAARFVDPDHYVASMPVVGQVPALAGLTKPAGGDPETRPEAEPQPLPIHDDEIGEIVVHRRCEGEACAVSLTGRGAPPRPAVTKGGFDRYWSEMAVPRGELRLRHDARADIWVVESEGAARTVFHGAGFVCEDLRARDVSGSASPPRGWIAGALLGLALGGVHLYRRRSASRRLATVLAGRDATIADTGWLAFDHDDSPPVRLSPDARIPPGPAVVLEGGAHGQVYRDAVAGSAVVVAAGSKEGLAATLRVEIAHRSAAALAVLALTVAPLAAACVIGLVF